MQGKADRRGAKQPAATPSGRPALAAFLLVGAGVAVAQPVDKQRRPPPLSQPKDAIAPVVRAATVRIVLPPPAPVAPTQVGALRAPLRDLEAAAPAEPESADLALPTAKAAPSGAVVHDDAIGQPDKQDLAAARGKAMATYSPARYELADSRKPQSISMVGDEDWAAMTRATATPDTSPSAAERTAALRPPESSPRSISGAVPIPLGPSAEEDAPARLAPVDTAPAKRPGIARVAFDVAAKVNGTAAGRVSLLIKDGENISVRLADLLGILQPRIEPELYDRLAGAQAAQSYVTFNDLRAAGIAVRFDDRDRLLIGTR